MVAGIHLKILFLYLEASDPVDGIIVPGHLVADDLFQDHFHGEPYFDTLTETTGDGLPVTTHGPMHMDYRLSAYAVTTDRA